MVWTSDPRRSPVSRIFAIVSRGELSRNPLFAPDLVASAARMFAKIAIAFIEVAIDCGLGFGDALVVAVVDNRPRHPTKDQLNDI